MEYKTFKKANDLYKRKDLFFDSFYYDSENGKLYWKKTNKIAGKLNSDGYLAVTFCGINLKAHRVCWLLYYGDWPNLIDHIDGVRTNNKISNLRSVDARGNSSNKAQHRAGQLAGTYFCKQRKKWASQITLNGKKIALGRYETMEEAHKAYKNKLEEYKNG